MHEKIETEALETMKESIEIIEEREEKEIDKKDDKDIIKIETVIEKETDVVDLAR